MLFPLQGTERTSGPRFTLTFPDSKFVFRSI